MHFENQKHYRRNLGRIKGLSKGLSRKVEGSRNWWKHSKKLAKAHYRVACQRQDTLHKMTTHVARTYALIGLEDLNVKGMLANHCLAQATSDASSKTCHACGWVKDDLILADRTFVCEQCGVVLDRDFNTSLTIRDEAIRLIREVPVVASSGQEFACGVGSSGSFCGTGETDLAVKQVRRCHFKRLSTFEYIVGSR